MARRLIAEVLEDRQLLSASLAPIFNLAVPAQLGYQTPLDGSGNLDPSQGYSVTSDNPDVQVSVAQGTFWTITVSHQPASSTDVTIDHETMTFQLFEDLTPQTAARIATLTNDGYYANGFPGQNPPIAAGQYIPRITSVASSGFSGVQGGSSSRTSTAASSGITPIATEAVQQLAFTGQYQIAMANKGSPNTTDAQFFITSGVPSTSVQQAFDFNYTIFGQLVSGQQTLADLAKVAVQPNPFFGGEKSQPISPIVITSTTLSSTNVNGVIHIDTTSARPGETANINVTATDPTDGSHVTQTFKVTVSAYNGPTTPAINFKPLPQLVTVSGVGEVFNKHHMVTEILVHFSGSVNSTQAESSGTYRLALPGAKGSYTAKNAKVIKLGTRVYDFTNFTVKLTLKTPLALTKKAQLLIFGQPPSGLTDISGRFIDGDHNGMPGGNATALLTRSGVILS
jgi:cyclophilin family peptidyl-prolyl cis-trans isomerase